MTARAHGTLACYVHGADGIGDGSGCRCDPCRRANAAYERARKRRAAPPYVDATEAREHVAWLAAHGVGLKRVAEKSGVSHGTLSKLVYGSDRRGPSTRIRPTTRDAIIAVKPSDGAPGSRIPAAPTHANVARLIDAGWSKMAISAAIGQGGKSLQLGDRWVTRRNAEAIRVLLDQEPPARQAGGARATVDRARDAVRVARQRAEGRLAAVPAAPERRYDVQTFLDHLGLTAGNLNTFYGVHFDRYPDGLTVTVAERWCARAGVTVAEVWPPSLDLPALDEGAMFPAAQCRRPDVPPRIFFADPRDRETIAAAKAVCATCRHRAECAEWAARHGEVGVWGGTTEDDRRHLVDGRATA